MKKIVSAITVGLLLLAGCLGTNVEEDMAQDGEFRVNLPAAAREEEPAEDTANQPESNTNYSDILPDGSAFFDLFAEPVVMLQFTPLIPGEELVVLHTNFGDITLRLFPDEAPLSVENFLTHARNGYYDGVIFHRVIEDFMIQGGDPTGTGGGGESIWGEPFFTKWMNAQIFEFEMPEGLIYERPSISLKHFRGALAMAHAGGAMGSQFYIVQNPVGHHVIPNRVEDILAVLAEIGDVPENLVTAMQEVAALYAEHGGTVHLDWWWDLVSGHIVFGHVVEGMDVVDAIADVEVGPGHRPIDDVIIERISFIEYGAE